MKNKIWTYTKVVLSIVFAILFQMNIDMGVPPEESFYSIDIIFEFFYLSFFSTVLKYGKITKIITSDGA